MSLREIGNIVRAHQKGNRVAIITDSNVSELYLELCVESIKEAGLVATALIFPAGEESKNSDTYLHLLNKVSEIPLTRSDGIVALGGGVVGDMAGFVAATYMRGIKVYQVPTTLLAQVDSSIGGKTGIDLPAGKNLVGAFHMPEYVLRDTEVLKTLPDNVFREGMAEVIKYGIISDSELFNELSDVVITKELAETQDGIEKLSGIIERCVAIKEGIVSEDEKDLGLRKILNFGHTLGHAVERLSGFGISHGDAVAKGMMRMTELALMNGWCNAETVDRIKNVLTSYGFGLEIEYDASRLLNAIMMDKKRDGDSIDIIIPEEIGKSRILNLTIQEFGRILEEYENR